MCGMNISWMCSNSAGGRGPEVRAVVLRQRRAAIGHHPACPLLLVSRAPGAHLRPRMRLRWRATGGGPQHQRAEQSVQRTGELAGRTQRCTERQPRSPALVLGLRLSHRSRGRPAPGASPLKRRKGSGPAPLRAGHAATLYSLAPAAPPVWEGVPSGRLRVHANGRKEEKHPRHALASSARPQSCLPHASLAAGFLHRRREACTAGEPLAAQRQTGSQQQQRSAPAPSQGPWCGSGRRRA